MTASEMLAAYVKVAKKKEVEDYVEEVLEDMSDEDLYCNFISVRGAELDDLLDIEDTGV